MWPLEPKHGIASFEEVDEASAEVSMDGCSCNAAALAVSSLVLDVVLRCVAGCLWGYLCGSLGFFLLCCVNRCLLVLFFFLSSFLCFVGRRDVM